MHLLMLWHHKCKQHRVTRGKSIGNTIYDTNTVLLARVTQSYVGNSSQSNPGSGWQTTSVLSVQFTSISIDWGWKNNFLW